MARGCCGHRRGGVVGMGRGPAGQSLDPPELGSRDFGSERDSDLQRLRDLQG